MISKPSCCLLSSDEIISKFIILFLGLERCYCSILVLTLSICFRLLLLFSFPSRSSSLVTVVWSDECCYRLVFVVSLGCLGACFVPPSPNGHTQGRLRGRCPRSWCHKSLPRFSAIHSLRSPSISRSYSYCHRWYETHCIALNKGLAGSRWTRVPHSDSWARSKQSSVCWNDPFSLCPSSIQSALNLNYLLMN